MASTTEMLPGQQVPESTVRRFTARLANPGWWPAGLVFAGSVGILATRMLQWPPAPSEDAWSYTLSGQALAAFSRPSLTFTFTTPKPLATWLALVVSPITPTRAMAVVTVLCAAMLVTSIFIYGYRQGGALAAFVAVWALAALPAYPYAFYTEQTDVMSAALLVTAIVTTRRPRMACLILLGLLRPQAWILAGIAGYLGAGGSRLRRAVVGTAYGAVAPVLWLLSDAIVYGNPLASYDTNNRINGGVPWHSVEVAVRYFGNALRADTGKLVLVAGLLGFGVAAVQRKWRPDPFLACVIVVLPLTLVATWLHLPYNTRYTFLAAVLLPLGCAHLAGLVPVPQWIRSRAVAAALLSLAILAWGAHTMPRAIYLRHVAKFTTMALHSAPPVSRALACGTLGVDARPHSWFFTIRLAGITRYPLSDFRWAKRMIGPADVAQTNAVILGPHPTPSIAAWVSSHGWRRTPITLGTLWTSPKCG
jgi:hypothetical protein